MDDAKLKPLDVGGYTPQPAAAVALVNRFKITEELLLREVDAVAGANRNEGAPGPLYDGRWAAVARTFFQEGFMALNRAVFQPARLSDEDIARLTPAASGPAQSE